MRPGPGESRKCLINKDLKEKSQLGLEPSSVRADSRLGTKPSLFPSRGRYLLFSATKRSQVGILLMFFLTFLGAESNRSYPLTGAVLPLSPTDTLSEIYPKAIISSCKTYYGVVLD